MQFRRCVEGARLSLGLFDFVYGLLENLLVVLVVTVLLQHEIQQIGTRLFLLHQTVTSLGHFYLILLYQKLGLVHTVQSVDLLLAWL
jgi:hypothetical protein